MLSTDKQRDGLTDRRTDIVIAYSPFTLLTLGGAWLNKGPTV